MEQTKSKTSARLRMLLTVACLLGGLLAGENVFRYAMEVPGWRHIDISQWGEYSRNADLKNGAYILPAEAIVGALVLMAASIIIIRSKGEFKPAALWVHIASVFALAGLGFTFLAAPYMLSVRTMGNDPVLLQQTFDHFHFWGSFRAIAQVLSFFASVVAMGKVYGSK